MRKVRSGEILLDDNFTNLNVELWESQIQKVQIGKGRMWEC